MAKAKPKKLSPLYVVWEDDVPVNANRPFPGATRYIPAASVKPKVCVWTKAIAPGMWDICDEQTTGISPYRFNYVHCPYCGGKIRIKR